MHRCSLCEWTPIFPWPTWPLAGQVRLGQNTVVGSMIVLLALLGNRPRGVCLDPHLRYKLPFPRLSGELPLVLAALHTGFRASELLSLTWDEVDLRRHAVTVRAAYAKNGESRTVPMNKVLTEVLRAVR